MNTDKKRRGAPNKPESKKRTARLGVIQLTAQELSNIEEAAKLDGENKSEWVRQALLIKAKRTLNKHKKPLVSD
jgi:Protein of unknown function (DUF1778).